MRFCPGAPQGLIDIKSIKGKAVLINLWYWFTTIGEQGVEVGLLLRSLYFAPILFALPGDRTPNLTTITVTTNHYTPYPMRRPWSRLSHSLMAVRLMFTS